LLATPRLISTGELQELVTLLGQLQDELCARDAVPARQHHAPACYWFQRGEALLGEAVREV